MKKIILAILLISVNTLQAEQPLAISGRLLDSNDAPIEEIGVSYKVQIKSGTCIAYEEVINKDMSTSKGYFNLSLGQGTISHGVNNLNLFGEGSVDCKDSSSLVLTKDSQRSFKISVKKSSESVYTDFSEQGMNSVGFAKTSSSLDGIKKEGFAQIVGSVTQSVLESLSAAKDSILSLSNGTSSLFVKPSELLSALAGKQDSLGYVPLNSANNLSDLASVPAAKTSLGLHAVASSGNYNDLINQPVFGSLASKSSIVESEISDLGTVVPLRSNFQACNPDQMYVQSGNNYICQNILLVDEASIPNLSIGKINNLQNILDSKLDQFSNVAYTTGATFSGNIITSNSIIAGTTIESTNKAKVDVNGTIVTRTYKLANTTLDIDVSKSNSIQVASQSSAAVVINNVQDGGNYTVVFIDSSNLVPTFTATAAEVSNPTLTVKMSYPMSTRTPGTHLILSISRIDTYVYINWQEF